ncbi:capsule biosynthesis protein CapK [Sorangium cellulosum]|uniref:Capsule biosynthesis protein CapK n=1 Tax=Sorangium cellulosum TaxID=56 RepID=A0A4P2QCX3_SORCE|nr:phenylacetate--CoA ligase family protein [Sorangium cellulosum]AUX27519.1 capsule biosynthesis protein CapK [Sorangium cellulosum]
MYGALFRHVLFPFYETRLRGRATLAHLDELERSQWRPERELRELNWRKMQEALRFAEQHVPWYRRRFAEYGVRAKDVHAPEDLARFPVLTKADLRKNGNELIADGWHGKLYRSGTGGSTGEPARFFYDHATYERRIAAALRAERWAGARLGEKELYIWGIPTMEPRWKKAKRTLYETVLRRKTISAWDLSEARLAGVVDEIFRYQPNLIVGYTSPLYYTARYALEVGRKLPSPRGIVATAERLFPHQREIIEKAFQAPVFDRYGCREMMLIGAECERHEGKHLNMENVFVEIQCGDRHAKPGEPGEIVLTDLVCRSMPLIRYKNEDVVIAADKPCSCGRGLPLLASVEGRVLDMIVGPDGQLVSAVFFPYFFKDNPTVERYQVHQDRSRAITIRIVPGDGYGPETSQAIERDLRRFLGERADIRVQVVDEIPVTKGGKFRFTVSEVPIEFGREVAA